MIVLNPTTDLDALENELNSLPPVKLPQEVDNTAEAVYKQGSIIADAIDAHNTAIENYDPSFFKAVRQSWTYDTITGAVGNKAIDAITYGDKEQGYNWKDSLHAAEEALQNITPDELKVLKTARNARHFNDLVEDLIDKRDFYMNTEAMGWLPSMAAQGFAEFGNLPNYVFGGLNKVESITGAIAAGVVGGAANAAEEIALNEIYGGKSDINYLTSFVLGGAFQTAGSLLGKAKTEADIKSAKNIIDTADRVARKQVEAEFKDKLNKQKSGDAPLRDYTNSTVYRDTAGNLPDDIKERMISEKYDPDNELDIATHMYAQSIGLPKSGKLPQDVVKLGSMAHTLAMSDIPQARYMNKMLFEHGELDGAKAELTAAIDMDMNINRIINPYSATEVKLQGAWAAEASNVGYKINDFGDELAKYINSKGKYKSPNSTPAMDKIIEQMAENYKTTNRAVGDECEAAGVPEFKNRDMQDDHLFRDWDGDAFDELTIKHGDNGQAVKATLAQSIKDGEGFMPALKKAKAELAKGDSKLSETLNKAQETNRATVEKADAAYSEALDKADANKTAVLEKTKETYDAQIAKIDAKFKKDMDKVNASKLNAIKNAAEKKKGILQKAQEAETKYKDNPDKLRSIVSKRNDDIAKVNDKKTTALRAADEKEIKLRKGADDATEAAYKKAEMTYRNITEKTDTKKIDLKSKLDEIKSKAKEVLTDIEKSVVDQITKRPAINEDELIDKMAEAIYNRMIKRATALTSDANLLSSGNQRLLRDALADSKNLTKAELDHINYILDTAGKDYKVNPMKEPISMDLTTKVGDIAITDLLHTPFGSSYTAKLKYWLGRAAMSRKGDMFNSEEAIEKAIDHIDVQGRKLGVSAKERLATKQQLQGGVQLLLNKPADPNEVGDGVFKAMRLMRKAVGLAGLNHMGIVQYGESGRAIANKSVNLAMQIPEIAKLTGQIIKGNVSSEVLRDFEDGAIGHIATRIYMQHPRIRLDDYGMKVGPMEKFMDKMQYFQTMASGQNRVQKVQLEYITDILLNKWYRQIMSDKFPARHMLEMGIDGVDVAAIKAEMKKHATTMPGLFSKSKLKSLNIAKWNPTIRRKFALMVHRKANNSVQNIMIGELPLWMNTATGKFLMQFRSFSVAALAKQTTRDYKMLTQGDIETAVAMQFMLTTSTISTLIKIYYQSLTLDPKERKKYLKDKLALPALTTAVLANHGDFSALADAGGTLSSALFGVGMDGNRVYSGKGITGLIAPLNYADRAYRGVTGVLQAPTKGFNRTKARAAYSIAPLKGLYGLDVITNQTLINQLPK